MENSAGTDFHPSAYWKEIDPNGEEIDKSIMNVGGHQFRAPTTSAADHDGQYADAPKKRNYAEQFDWSPFTALTRLQPEKNKKGNYKRDKNRDTMDQ